MTSGETFRRMLPIVRILWGALTTSTVMVAVVSFIVKPEVKEGPAPAIVMGLSAVAVMLAVMSFVLPPRLAANAARQQNAQVMPAEIVPGEPRPGTFAHPGQAARQAMAAGQTTFILSMALSEAVSLLGLVLHMLGAPMMITAPFFAVGTMLAATRFPTVQSLVGPFERAHGAIFTPQDLTS